MTDETKPELSELEEIKAKAEEYLNNWKRAAADFINYKKEEMERAGMLIKYAKEDMFLNIVPVLDSIYLLEKHAKVEGIEAIKKQITEFLKEQGIEEIETAGKPFDPNFHEIIEEIGPSEALAKGAKPGTIIEELKKGYMMDKKVIRPAKVNTVK